MYNILIVGSGFVGQATGKSLFKLGHHVIFCDTDEEKVAMMKREGFRACGTDEIGKIDPDIIFLTVSTPTVDGRIFLDHISAAAKNVAEKILRKTDKNTLVVVKSTVPPGTTEHIVTPILEKYSRKKAGIDFEVAMNPEYLRERLAIEDFENPKLVLIGSKTKRARETLCRLYGPYAKKCPIALVSPSEAEMQKYTHNLWNATKISFFNEMRIISGKLGLNADHIFRLTMKSAEASWNPEYGTRNMGPYEGSCLPKDTSAFLHWSKNQIGMDPLLLKSVIEINESIKKSRSSADLKSQVAASVRERDRSDNYAEKYD